MTPVAAAAVVVGYGSVGRRHAAVASSLAPALAIVESKAEAREGAATDHPQATIAADLAGLDSAGFPWPDAVAVIATWGPSHASVFHALADRGVRRILCEKPMASSVCDAVTMVARARRDGIALGVHHYVRYAGLAPALRALAAEHQLGQPVSLVVEGGAACLLTNGIHFVDFASELFDGEPERVVSTASGDPINPRSPDLHLYGGTAIWSFAEGREAIISFSNRSSVAPSARIFYRDAVVELDGALEARVLRRDPEAVQRFPAVTRTGPASELRFQGTIPGVRGYLDGMRRAFEDVASGDVLCPGEAGAAAVTACIGALVASRDGRSVTLPVDPASTQGREPWPIS